MWANLTKKYTMGNTKSHQLMAFLNMFLVKISKRILQLLIRDRC